MKALVIVDYQNDHVIGPMGFKYAKLIEKNICARIEDMISSRGDLFFVIDSFGEDYLDTAEGRRNPIVHCIRGTEGEQLYGEISRYSSKGHIIRKQTFGSDELMRRLKSYDEIELCGLETNTDVMANAILARTVNPSADVRIYQNCVAAKDSMLGEESMDILSSLGVTVL